MDQEPDDTTELSAVDGMLAKVLEHSAADRAAALEDVCLRYPSHAEELRSRYRVLQAIGLLTEPPRDGRAFPDRLGDFRLLEPLGGGGMGVVYRAREEPLGREVALKLIRPDHLYFPGARAWFQREIEAIASLQHPGIVPIYRVGEADGMPFFAMELVAGVSLAQAIGRVRRVPQERLVAADLAQAVGVTGRALSGPFALGGWVDACVAVVLQVGEALAHAHARGVVHRDVKPSNVMLTPDGRARLVDFGLASRSGAQKLTRTGATMGSLAYMAPEQVRGERVDARVDVYALGVTLYELLTLQEPFVEESSDALRAAIQRGQPKSIRGLNRKVAWDVETVCLHAMAPEVHRRYATMAEFIADLRRLMLREPIAARRPGLALRARRLVQRHPTAMAAGVLGALLCTVLPTALWWQQRAANRQISAALARAEAEAETARRSVGFLVDSVDLANPERGGGEVFTVRQMADLAAQRFATELRDQPLVQGALMSALGRLYRAVGSFEAAERLLAEALPLLDAAQSRQAAVARVELARVERALGRVPNAERVLEGLSGEAAAQAGMGVAREIELARLRHERGEREAAQAALDALEADCRAHGRDRELRDVLIARIRLLVSTGGYRLALDKLAEADALVNRLDGPGSALAAELAFCRGRALRAAGNAPDSARAFLAAEAMMRRLFGDDSLRVAEVLESTALVLADLQATTIEPALRAKLPQGGSEELLDKALAIRRRLLPADHPSIAHALTLQGEVALSQDRAADAAAAFSAAKDIYARQPVIDRRLLASVAGQHAYAAFVSGDAGALAAAEQTAELYQQLDAPSESEAEFRSRFAVMLYATGASERALAAAESSLELRRQLHPPGHEAIGSSLTTLVTFALQLDQIDAALRFADEAVALRTGERADSAAHGSALLGRGAVLTKLGRADEAAADVARGLELVRRHQSGQRNVIVAATTAGQCYHLLGRLAEATAAYAEAIQCAGTIVPLDDPLQQSLRWRAARVRLAAADFDGAVTLCDEGLAMAGKRALPGDLAELRRVLELARRRELPQRR